MSRDEVLAMKESPTISNGLFVLGMHRSGTSALTRVLNLMGIYLGDDLLDARGGNSSGHWESIRVIELNERVLFALGRSWSDPREMGADWMHNSCVKALLPDAVSLLEENFLPHGRWAIKDPRISRLLPFWLAAAKSCSSMRLSAVVALRHPWEVASSLNHRDGIALSQGFLLWLHHIREALSASGGMKRIVVRYCDLLTDWRSEVTRVSDAFNLSFDPAHELAASRSIGLFLDAGARHENHTSSTTAVPAELISLFEQLGAARSEEDIQAASDFADSILMASECYRFALGDIYVHQERLHRRVGELEIAASAGYQEREDGLKRDIKAIEQHLAHADWVNRELENSWREAENKRREVEIEVLRLEEAGRDQAEQILQLQLERDTFRDELESAFRDLRQQVLRNQQLSDEIANWNAYWWVRAIRWLSRWWQ